MKAKTKSPKANSKEQSWDEFKQERFAKDPEEALLYLQSSIEENYDMPKLIVEAIRTYCESQNMTIDEVAKRAHLKATTAYTALGKKGNPTLETLTLLLKSLGLKISIERAS